ncbi:hypothetical protein OH807_03485 [Kitasatospora sp. NBC_01560]|uniref:hypothetical protein n=1 Tax=Kitasatospora sp. NBC_01560 TaxID=2975965 RepID=UPI0038677D30
MSVNIDLHLSVSGLADQDEAEQVLGALAGLLREEGIEDEVPIGWVDDRGEYFVTGESRYALSISRFYRWRPAFEEAVARVVGDAVPAAKPTVTWGYPDEED